MREKKKREEMIDTRKCARVQNTAYRNACPSFQPGHSKCYLEYTLKEWVKGIAKRYVMRVRVRGVRVSSRARAGRRADTQKHAHTHIHTDTDMRNWH